MELVLLVILLGIVVRLGALVDCGCLMHLVWDGGMLEVGDVIEVEVAEFDEASAPVWEEKHCCPTRTASNDTDNPKEWEHKLDLYYRLKKVLEDENLI